MLTSDFCSLFDRDSFVETLSYSSGDAPGDGGFSGTVTGYGTIGDRLIFAAFDSGSGADVQPAHGINFGEKVVRTLKLAVSRKAPFMFVLKDSKVPALTSQEILKPYYRIIDALNDASGDIPLIFVSLGECLGIFSLIAARCDLHFIVGDSVRFGSLSPEAVSALTGTAPDTKPDKISFSPSISGIFGDLNKFRSYFAELLRYIPDNIFYGLYHEAGENIDALESGVFTDNISMLKNIDLVRSLPDNGAFAELFGYAGRGVLTGFSSFGGYPTGLICADGSGRDGLLDMDSLKKIRWFSILCNNFGIPMVFLLDYKGLYASGEDVHIMPAVIAGIAAELKCNNAVLKIVTGEAYGELNAVLLSGISNEPASMAYAWENTYIDAINPASAALMKYKSEIASSDDPIDTRLRYIDEYKKANSRSEFAAMRGIIDDIIDPAETRNRIISFLKVL